MQMARRIPGLGHNDNMKLARIFLCLPFAAGLLHAEIVSPNTNLNAREEQIIVAAKNEDTPAFNGAQSRRRPPKYTVHLFAGGNG